MKTDSTPKTPKEVKPVKTEKTEKIIPTEIVWGYYLFIFYFMYNAFRLVTLNHNYNDFAISKISLIRLLTIMIF